MMDDRRNTEKSGPSAGEKSGPTAGRKEHSQLQARTKQRRLAAPDRPQGSSFRKGRSQDSARDVTRIRRAAQRRRQLSRRVWDARQARQEEHRLRDQFIYTLGGTVQVIVPVLPKPELSTPPTTQSNDQKRNDGMPTNKSEAISRRCRVVLWRWTEHCRPVSQEHLGCDRQRCCFHNGTAPSDVFQPFFRRFLWRRGVPHRT